MPRRFPNSLSICMVMFLHLVCRNRLAVNGTPGINDICQHERNQNRHVCHRSQSELTGATVCQSQRTLQVGRRRIIGCVIIPYGQQQKPVLSIPYRFRPARYPGTYCLQKNALPYPPQYTGNSQQEQYQQIRHGQQVMEILERFHIYFTCSRNYGKTVFQQSTDHESQKEYQERNSITHQLPAASEIEIFMTDVVQEIKCTEQTGKEEYGKTKNQIPRISKSIQPMPAVGPLLMTGIISSVRFPC